MLSLLQEMTVVSPRLKEKSNLATAPANFSSYQTCHFRVDVVSGPLDGETFLGRFSYDPALLTEVGLERVSPNLIEFSFCGDQFHITDDIHYPLRPTIKFMNGVLGGLDYQVWIQRCFGINQDSFWYEGGQGVISYSHQG